MKKLINEKKYKELVDGISTKEDLVQQAEKLFEQFGMEAYRLVDKLTHEVSKKLGLNLNFYTKDGFQHLQAITKYDDDYVESQHTSYHQWCDNNVYIYDEDEDEEYLIFIEKINENPYK